MDTLPAQRADNTHFFVRNALALSGLLLAMYLPDIRAIELRAGWDKLTPYLFALLLYAWLIFHNRILFERLFERGKRKAYVLWTLLFILCSSLNITLILHYLYQMSWAMPVLIKFYIFSLTGFATYIAYRQLTTLGKIQLPKLQYPSQALTVIVDGTKYEVPSESILYIESLQNYVRIFTAEKQLITRTTMKQISSDLPAHFLRINRSCLVNLHYVDGQEGDDLLLRNSRLRIGRTYKQHVNEHIKKSNLHRSFEDQKVKRD